MALVKDDWEQHWGDYAESASENPAQLYRRRLIFGRMHGEPRRFVDIGAGQGDLVAEVVERFPGSEVLGLEGSRGGVEMARTKVPGATFLQRDLLDAASPPEAYSEWATDAVCSEVLEHVDDPGLLLRQSRAYLAPGCRLIVTVPGGPRSAFDRHIGHRKHYRREDLERLLEDAGFVVEEVSAAGFPFFNLYRLAVICRGKKLIDDVASTGGAGSSMAARVTMRVFRLLFALNLPGSRWGWQLAATVRVPGDER